MKPILLVEDNEDDAFFMQRALRDAGLERPIRHVEDGQQAIEYLSGNGRFGDRTQHPLPELVLLDLKLPFRSGHDVLNWIRAQPALKSLVVIVLTSSSEPVDINRAYQSGVNSYVVKPPTAGELGKMAACLREWWLLHNRFGSAVA